MHPHDRDLHDPRADGRDPRQQGLKLVLREGSGLRPPRRWARSTTTRIETFRQRWEELSGPKADGRDPRQQGLKQLMAPRQRGREEADGRDPVGFGQEVRNYFGPVGTT